MASDLRGLTQFQLPRGDDADDGSKAFQEVCSLLNAFRSLSLPDDLNAMLACVQVDEHLSEDFRQSVTMPSSPELGARLLKMAMTTIDPLIGTWSQNILAMHGRAEHGGRSLTVQLTDE